MIQLREFQKLRLSSFVNGVVALEDWQFMGRTWVGEAVGFSEWLCPSDHVDDLGSLSLDLGELPSEVVLNVLAKLKLPLRPGMSLSEVCSILGEPCGSETFVEDRTSHSFEITDPDNFSVSCTIQHKGGLCYIVVMAFHD